MNSNENTDEAVVENSVESSASKSGFSLFGTVAGLTSSALTQTTSATKAVGSVVTSVPKFFERPPLPEIDIEGLIGQFVMSEFGGTRFEGQLSEEFNEKLPPMLTYGGIRVSLHENGIRIDQKKGYPLLIQQKATANISLQRHPIKRTKGVVTDLVSHALDGAIGGGLLGAGVAASKAALDGKVGTMETIIIFYVRITFASEEAKKWTLVIQAEPEFAELFIQRVQEREWPSSASA